MEPKRVCERKVQNVSVDDELPLPVFGHRRAWRLPEYLRLATVNCLDIVNNIVTLFFLRSFQEIYFQLFMLLSVQGPLRENTSEAHGDNKASGAQRCNKGISTRETKKAEIFFLLGEVLPKLVDGASKKGI